MQYTNLELENLTLQWGIDRKITINGKLETQFLKLIEESGELFSSGDDIEKIKDAIGDQLVVLTMINGLTNDRFILDISIDQPSSFSEAVRILCRIQGELASNIVRSKISEISIYRVGNNKCCNELFSDSIVWSFWCCVRISSNTNFNNHDFSTVYSQNATKCETYA